MSNGFILTDVPLTIMERIRAKVVSAGGWVWANSQWSLESWTYDRVDLQIQYSDLGVQSSVPVNLDRSEFRNCTSVQASETWQRTSTTQDNASWTNSSGFKLGLNLSVVNPAKGATLGGATPSIEYSTESSTTQSHQEAHGWQLSQTIFVTPHTRVDAEWNVYEDQFASDYTTVIQPRGMQIVAGLAFEWPLKVSIPFKVDDYLTSAEQTFQGHGTFAGTVGNRTVTNVTETPIFCGEHLVLPFEAGMLAPETQHAMDAIKEQAAAAGIPGPTKEKHVGTRRQRLSAGQRR
jgi:hypothetical protein